METLRSPSPATRQNHVEMMSTYDCLSTAITLGRSAKRTCCLRTGFFVFMNTALVQWFSKQHATVETSVLWAEFVAMKIGMESLRGLCYKLCMVGVGISGPSYIYGDDMLVIHNTQRPESMLKKKTNSICYHAVHKSSEIDSKVI